MKEKVIDLWITQMNVDKLQEKIEAEKKQLKELVESMTNEELTLLMDSFYARQEHAEVDVPEAIVYAIHELADREDKKINDEEVPF